MWAAGWFGDDIHTNHIRKGREVQIIHKKSLHLHSRSLSILLIFVDTRAFVHIIMLKNVPSLAGPEQAPCFPRRSGPVRRALLAAPWAGRQKAGFRGKSSLATQHRLRRSRGRHPVQDGIPSEGQVRRFPFI